MLNTKNLVSRESNVPSYWVFQHYLTLSETLTGQDIKIKSVFNPTERTPSMCIFVDKSIMQYKFKCFSTGKYGSKIDLVKELFNIDYSQAVTRIVEDYNKYAKTNGSGKTDFKIAAKWKIDFIKERGWFNVDADYWLAYNIGSSLLKEYNVRPIDYYNMVKEDTGEIKSLQIKGKHMYGYFDKEGDIYKIYQPLSKRHKFHKVKPYLQGYDQLKYSQPYLVICSSLKDAMCLKSFGLKVEVIAPDSENTIIKPYIVENLKKKYKKVITLFDNDEAGHKAIQKYKEMYNLDGCSLNNCKDISDAVKQHSAQTIANSLRSLLIKTLKQ
tara:strand:- start:21 stop:998 length:978 start_codon:yes stop_codon:yes gene_type:complete